MKEIIPISNIDARVCVPGSKSLTHRAFIVAALANGKSHLENILYAEDTMHTVSALKQMGVEIEINGKTATIIGRAGKFSAPKKEIYLGNSGTSMRLLTAICALGQGRFVLTGDSRMKQRPIGDLLDALALLGVSAYSIDKNGCPPVAIEAMGIMGGNTRIETSISSQFLSGLLLAAPYAKNDVTIEVIGHLPSKPYVDLTLKIVEDFGVKVHYEDYKYFFIPSGQLYKARDYTIEGDLSSASYFFAAAAILGGKVTVSPINIDSKQPDIGFLGILKEMGCKIMAKRGEVTVIGGDLRGICVDMNAMPDLVPTLAVVASFAKGETIIKNVAHLRAKECDRLSAIAKELAKMDIKIDEREDSLIIKGGSPKGVIIETYNDHRIAMGFAIAGLKVPGIKIINPACVNKSFPEFWDILGGLNTKNGKFMEVQPP